MEPTKPFLLRFGDSTHPGAAELLFRSAPVPPLLTGRGHQIGDRGVAGGDRQRVRASTHEMRRIRPDLKDGWGEAIMV